MGALSDSNKTNSEDEALVNDILGASGLEGAVSVGTSAVEAKVGASRLTNRKLLVLQPKDVGVYLGFTSSVTTSSGVELFKDSVTTISASDETQVWLIATGASKSVRVLEST